MITVFEKIPALFVEAYDASFQVWAREFQKRGPRCAIPFARPPGEPVLLDQAGRPIQAGAWFEAEVDRSGPAPRVVIRPATEHDAEMIARHVRDLQGMRLQ